MASPIFSGTDEFFIEFQTYTLYRSYILNLINKTTDFFFEKAKIVKIFSIYNLPLI